MLRLKVKLALFNLFSKLAVTAIFIIFMPYLIGRINLRQIDNDLIKKREEVISIISEIGIEPFIEADSTDTFGNYNILKEEFIAIEPNLTGDEINHIEISKRLIDDDVIEYRVLSYSLGINGKSYILEVGKSLESISQTNKNIRNVMLIFLFFIITVTFLTDFQYTRRLLRPLDFIINKIKTISTPSTYDRTKIKTSTTDFVRLDETLTELMDRIEKLFAKEKEITVNISHELMTPLSVLRSKLENIMLTENLEPEIEVKIEECLKTLYRLQSLINSLLLIEKIESRQYLRNDTFQLRDVLHEIIEELSPIAADAGININHQLPEPLEIHNANRSLIFSMFYNVINNAIKNTGKGGVINVESIPDKNTFTVCISDTGKGMTEEQMKNLFTRFKNGTKNRDNSTGIGLAITKTIADFHDILIRVESQPGKGTKFYFIFSKNS